MFSKLISKLVVQNSEHIFPQRCYKGWSGPQIWSPKSLSPELFWITTQVMAARGHISVTLWIIKILVYNYGNLTHLTIISISKYVKTNGNNPIHFPLQMTSEARVRTEQQELQGVGGRRQRRSGNAESNTGGVGWGVCLAILYGGLSRRSQTLFLLWQSEEGAMQPQPPEKGQWHKSEGRYLPCFQVHYWSHSSYTLLPSTRFWASQEAVKIPYWWWWPQHPVQCSAYSKHVLNDCEQGCPRNHLRISREIT